MYLKWETMLTTGNEYIFNSEGNKFLKKSQITNLSQEEIGNMNRKQNILQRGIMEKLWYDFKRRNLDRGKGYPTANADVTLMLTALRGNDWLKLNVQ